MGMTNEDIDENMMRPMTGGRVSSRQRSALKSVNSKPYVSEMGKGNNT